MRWQQLLSRLHREESGQDMLEYAMVLAAVLAAVISGSNSLATTINAELAAINAAIASLTIP